MMSAPSPFTSAVAVLEQLIGIGERYGGLWPSCLYLDSHEPIVDLPQAIGGQRECDRSPGGCNLMHDLPAIGLLYRLAKLMGKGEYDAAADQYLRAFTAITANSATGLFPWGEHSWIDTKTREIGDGYLYPVYQGENSVWWDGLPRPIWHDHLRQAPAWFWEKLGDLDPRAVQRFADGLDAHWYTDERTAYNRHAPISRNMRHGLRTGVDTCDFPRHSGFYILDLACAYVQEPRQATFLQIERYLDHWWSRRVEGQCLPLRSIEVPGSAEAGEFNASQTLSLAMSLWEAASVLSGSSPELSKRLRKSSRVYAEAFISAPHAVDAGEFVHTYSRDSGAACKTYPLLGSRYSDWPAALPALLCCAWYREHKDERFLAWAAAVGSRSTGQQCRIASKEVQLPALDVGLTLDLLCDLYSLTDCKDWLARANEFWQAAAPVYFTGGLVRAASRADWYEAQQGSAYLLRGACRLGLLLQSDGTLDIGAEYSAQ